MKKFIEKINQYFDEVGEISPVDEKRVQAHEQEMEQLDEADCLKHPVWYSKKFRQQVAQKRHAQL